MLVLIGWIAAINSFLLAVDTIPDIFRTTANVTANMGAAVVLARGERYAEDPAG